VSTEDIANRRTNLIGASWMVAAMAAFAVEDALIKATAKMIPLSQVMLAFGLGGAIIFACLALYNKERLFSCDVVSSPMRIRALFEVVGRLFYFLAISLTSLSSTTVILQATPLVVVASAALIFGEKVGWRRWAAIFVGLAGVIIIIRPGTEGFSLLSIFAIVGMLGFAGRDLASRAAPQSLSVRILGLYGFLSIVLAGVFFSYWEGKAFVWPDTITVMLLLAAIFTGIFAYIGLMKAMRTGEVSAVTPFRYTRLIFGVALGVLVFNEALSVPMVVGSTLILVSGLFILWRGKQIAKQN